MLTLLRISPSSIEKPELRALFITLAVPFSGLRPQVLSVADESMTRNSCPDDCIIMRGITNSQNYGVFTDALQKRALVEPGR